MRAKVPIYICILVALLFAGSAWAQPGIPEVSENYRSISDLFQDYEVVLRPDTIAPEWWAGAPSVAVGDDGTVWLACRMRTAESERGLRG